MLHNTLLHQNTQKAQTSRKETNIVTCVVDMYIVMTSGHINCVESGGGGEHEEFCS